MQFHVTYAVTLYLLWLLEDDIDDIEEIQQVHAAISFFSSLNRKIQLLWTGQLRLYKSVNQSIYTIPFYYRIDGSIYYLVTMLKLRIFVK